MQYGSGTDQRGGNMISISIFPCMFTDGARVLGDLSYTLDKPIYTDLLVFQKMSEKLGITIENIRKKLLSGEIIERDCDVDRERLVDCAKKILHAIAAEDREYIYYGFLSALINKVKDLPLKILVFGDEDCRIKRAMRQEHLSRSAAGKALCSHDLQAACWTRYLYGREPYDPEMYDAVIWYDCQDLMDVVAYICLLYEDLSATLDYMRC